MGEKRNKKGQSIMEEPITWIIAVIVLLLVGFLYFKISGRGEGLLEYFKNFWRFGR